MIIEKLEPKAAIKITAEEAEKLGIDLERPDGKLFALGAWQVPIKFVALCCSAKYGKTKYGMTVCKKKVFYGTRTLTNIRQPVGGYELEGQVSVKGKKYSAFTSSQMFEIDGKLIDVATIHARIK